MVFEMSFGDVYGLCSLYVEAGYASGFRCLTGFELLAGLAYVV